MIFKFQDGGVSVIGKNASTDIIYTPQFPESMARQPKEINMEIPMAEEEKKTSTPQPFVVPKSELPEIKEDEDDDAIESGDWNKNVESMYYWLKKNSGFNDIQISGLLACLSNESSLNPAAVNQGEMKKWNGDHRAGRGIAQWSLERNLEYSKWHNENYGSTGSHYADQDDLATQLSFVLYEMQQRPAFMRAFQNAKTPEEAADAVRRGYENGCASALASAEQMDRYTQVGSPSASGFYNSDKKMADKIYKIISEWNH